MKNTTKITIPQEKLYTEEELTEKMQYYYIHCVDKSYITPQEWLKNTNKENKWIKEIDFNGNLLARIKYFNDELKVTGAVDRYGNEIDISKCNIKSLTT